MLTLWLCKAGSETWRVTSHHFPSTVHTRAPRTQSCKQKYTCLLALWPAHTFTTLCELVTKKNRMLLAHTNCLNIRNISSNSSRIIDKPNLVLYLTKSITRCEENNILRIKHFHINQTTSSITLKITIRLEYTNLRCRPWSTPCTLY